MKIKIQNCGDADCRNGSLIAQLTDIAFAGSAMRDKQKDCFRNRGHSALVASKQAEAEFDRLLSAVVAK